MGLCRLPPALVTEYCARGSLYDCLHAARTSPAVAAELTWARRLGMVRGQCMWRAVLGLNAGESGKVAPPPLGLPAFSTRSLSALILQAIDAGTGLLYLHSRNIVHRDGALLLLLLVMLLMLPTCPAAAAGDVADVANLPCCCCSVCITRCLASR